jgi:hypothetical protein
MPLHILFHGRQAGMKFNLSLARKHPVFVGITSLFLCFILWIAYAIAATRWPWVFDWGEVRRANKVIAAVNSYQAEHGRLPETLTEVGIEDPDSLDVFYRKTSDGTYIVWFGTVLGESATYESSTRSWH